jgi:hypothetical protein
MHSLAAQLPSAGRLLARAGQGGDPRSQRGPVTALAALPRTETFVPTIALYLRKEADRAATRRCRMTAGAAAETAVLPLAGLLAARGLPPADPETDTLPIQSSGPYAHRLPTPWLRPPTPSQRPVRGSGTTRPRASTQGG